VLPRRPGIAWRLAQVAGICLTYAFNARGFEHQPFDAGACGSSASNYASEIEALSRRGRLNPDHRANSAAVRQALYGFLNPYLA
jgi:hypothetical protein